MNFPTPTFVRNLVFTSLVSQYQKQLDMPLVYEVMNNEIHADAEGTHGGNDLIKKIVNKFNVDLDDLVYEIVSSFDNQFLDDPDWFDEDDSDEKDRIRDEVLELIGL